MSNKKSLSDKLTYAYLRKIKKWMFCPACQKGKMSINKSGTIWTCEDCSYQLANAVFEGDYVFWFCEECGTYLNNQDGFDRHAQNHICQNCGYENDTTFDNIKGMCSDCGKLIPDPDATLCLDCKQARREKAKQWLITAGKVVGTVAAVAGVAYLSSQSNEQEDSNMKLIPESDNYNDDIVYGLGDGEFPTCKYCGSKMTIFDDWTWYTCPECEGMAKTINGKATWSNEIF